MSSCIACITQGSAWCYGSMCGKQCPPFCPCDNFCPSSESECFSHSDTQYCKNTSLCSLKSSGEKLAGVCPEGWKSPQDATSMGPWIGAAIGLASILIIIAVCAYHYAKIQKTVTKFRSNRVSGLTRHTSGFMSPHSRDPSDPLLHPNATASIDGGDDQTNSSDVFHKQDGSKPATLLPPTPQHHLQRQSSTTIEEGGVGGVGGGGSDAMVCLVCKERPQQMACHPGCPPVMCSLCLSMGMMNPLCEKSIKY
eukprot:PhF_6_TR29183/c0_g1_i1/m.42684